MKKTKKNVTHAHKVNTKKTIQSEKERLTAKQPIAWPINTIKMYTTRQKERNIFS